MGTHPIFESDFDCLTEMMIDNFNVVWQAKFKALVMVILVIVVWRYSTTENPIDESHIVTVKNDIAIEPKFVKRKKILKRACRFLNKIIGVWISGSMHDLIYFHGLILDTKNTDNDIEDFLSNFNSPGTI